MSNFPDDMTIATISGISSYGGFIHVELNKKLLKHLRRCVKHYEHIHPTIDENNSNSKILINQLEKFGFKRGAVVKKEKRIYIYNLFNYTCVKCKTKKHESDLTISHIKSQSDGGTHHNDNLEVLCCSCREIDNYEKRLARKIEETNKLKMELYALLQKRKEEEIVAQ